MTVGSGVAAGTTSLKGTSSFISQVKRNSLKDKGSPGPGEYRKECEYEIAKNPKGAFGSVSKRNAMIARDAQKSPFNDPTSTSTPGPGNYDLLKSGKKNKTETGHIRKNSTSKGFMKLKGEILDKAL